MADYAEIASKLNEVFRQILPPPSQQRSMRKRGKLPDVPKAMKLFYEEALIMRERHRLGVYGRARVAFELQKQLLTEGYPADLCRQVLFSLIVSAFISH